MIRIKPELLRVRFEVNMTAKEYLTQLRKLMLKTKSRVAQCETIRDHLVFLQGIDYSKDKVQTSAADQLSETMATLLDLEQETVELIYEYNRMYHEALNRIDGLSKWEYVKILKLRYLSEKPSDRKFEHIACELDRSYVRTCHMHGEALQEFEKKYLK